MSSARILTELERIILNALNNTIENHFNKSLENTNIVVNKINIHLVDRIKDRNLEPEEVNKFLKLIANQKLCQLIFECEYLGKEFTTFTVQIYDILFLHGTYKKGLNKTIITFRTVIPYRSSYVFDDAVLKILKE